MHTREEKLKAFGRMLDVVDTLREKCPWDRKQTNESLRPNTIEEVFELADAISKSDTHNICKELGDVLLHICFYSRIGSETGDFDIADVCNALVDKLIFRHPHVYHPSQIGAPDPKPLPYGEEKAENADGEEVKTAQQVIQNWEQLKLKEKDGNSRVCLMRYLRSSKLIAYRTRLATWASIGKTRATSGLRCAKNLANWKQNFATKTATALRLSLATSYSAW